MPPLTAETLKAALWETLQAVKAEKMLPQRADAIATQAREILRTVKVQMQILGQTKQPVPVDIVQFSGHKTVEVVAPKPRIANGKKPPARGRKAAP